jgi:hypothetical protein
MFVFHKMRFLKDEKNWMTVPISLPFAAVQQSAHVYGLRCSFCFCRDMQGYSGLHVLPARYGKKFNFKRGIWLMALA